MAQSDLILRQEVNNVLQSVFKKYHVGYRPEGEVEFWGMGADLPQQLDAIEKSYDVDKVLTEIDEGQSLNIPHQGYCMNKDIAKSIIQEGWNKQVEFPDVSTSSEDVEKAIAIMKRFKYCGECDKKHGCSNCSRYKAKKYTLIALQFYSKLQKLYDRIDELKESSESEDAKFAYQSIEDEIKKINDYAVDHSPV